jgi:diguanylate cyclase (GGDEF)-like protein
MSSLIKLPSECRLLVVDDEPTVCDLLRHALASRYRTSVCRTGAEACRLLAENNFDVVVADLRLPDMSGIDVLSFAKSKDAYTEVLIITGFATIESASVAINLGASSYIAKPLSLTDLYIQVERAVASRLFHLKSISLMRRSDDFAPEFKDHLSDITALYYFTRRLTLSLEIAEIMRITLEEANRKSGALFCAIGVHALGFTEIYAMPAAGELDDGSVRTLLLDKWDTLFPFIDKGRFGEGAVPVLIYKGRQGSSPRQTGVRPLSIPMMITGTAIGTLALFFEEDATAAADPYFLYIISSIVSPLIEHGYSVLQARQLAKTDGLTGIANHRSFHEALDREIARVNRKGGFFSLIVMDLDDFKSVNDTYGHPVGDAVLKDLVVRVLENIRTVDVFSRYGGEEFGLVLPETDQAGAEVLAQRIKNAINARAFTYAQHRIAYTASMGIAVYNGQKPEKKDALIARADSAMYVSKRGGKNRISLGAATV